MPAIYTNRSVWFSKNSDIQLFNTTVAEELAFGPRQLGLPEEEINKRVNDTLELLEIEHLKDRIPYHLSGGEKKLVAIASVLTMNPNVLLFDEPFNGLSPKYQTPHCGITTRVKSSRKNADYFLSPLRQIQEVIQRVLVFSEEHTLTGDFTKEEWEGNPEFRENFHLG